MSKDASKTIGMMASIATIIGTCIAAIALIPTFGAWLSPREPIQQYTIPTDSSSPNINQMSPTAIPVQPTFAPTLQLPARSIGHRQIANNGTEDLILESNHVAIGTADKFQDLLQYDYPPYTVFVIYGEANTQLSLYWGGWDLWENASESFIEEQLSIKLQEVISSHPEDYDKRGYRVIKCYGSVDNCENIFTFP